MKFLLIICGLVCAVSIQAQSRLRDSLFAGKLKADTGSTYVSKDTSKYVAPVAIISEPVSGVPGAKKTTEVPKLDEAIMPDSLNKSYYSRQRVWKRFIESNTVIINQNANDTKKVKKGEYQVEIQFEIGVNGKVATNSVSSNPPNEFLVEQFTELMKRAPLLAAPVYADGKPRPMPVTQTVSIVKK